MPYLGGKISSNRYVNAGETRATIRLESNGEDFEVAEMYWQLIKSIRNSCWLKGWTKRFKINIISVWIQRKQFVWSLGPLIIRMSLIVLHTNYTYIVPQETKAQQNQSTPAKSCWNACFVLSLPFIHCNKKNEVLEMHKRLPFFFLYYLGISRTWIALCLRLEHWPIQTFR